MLNIKKTLKEALEVHAIIESNDSDNVCQAVKTETRTQKTFGHLLPVVIKIYSKYSFLGILLMDKGNNSSFRPTCFFWVTTQF